MSRDAMREWVLGFRVEREGFKAWCVCVGVWVWVCGCVCVCVCVLQKETHKTLNHVSHDEIHEWV